MPLHDLLSAAQAYGPAYGAAHARLSNHLPMALIALDHLGAEEGQLHAFFQDYRPRLEPAGDDRDFVELRDRYAAQLNTEGIAQTLRKAVPALLPRLGAAAFHCAIRTAYAVEAGLSQELASALAYWASADFEPAPIAPRGTLSVAEALAAARADDALHFEARHDTTIQSDMEAAFALPGFGAAARRVALEQLSLRHLAQAALAIYLDGGDFAALHLVTGLHAARVLSAYVEEDALVRRLWPLLLAVYIAIGRPVPRFDQVDAPRSSFDWPALFARARQLRDEHTIKLAYTAHCEWRAYGWPGYALAATRRL